MLKKNYSFLLALLLCCLGACAGREKGFKSEANAQITFQDLPFAMPSITLPRIPDYLVDITSFGAKGDGQTLNTTAFSDAIESCSRKGGGHVIVPAGLWLTGPILLKSYIDLHLEEGACILFSKNIADYPVVTSQYEGLPTFRRRSPISGVDLENVSITGAGIIDGSGQAWRPVKKEKLTAAQWKNLLNSGGAVAANGKIWYPSQQAMAGEALCKKLQQENVSDPAQYVAAGEFLRPVMISLIRCKKVLFSGPAFQNSPAWNIHPFLCEDVVLRDITVRNPWYAQNGDGVDLESCRRVLLERGHFDVGDDAICVKSGKDAAGRLLGRPCEELVIQECTVYHGHGGFTIGSEMSGGVRNVVVRNCTFIGTDLGLRFKSLRGRGGVVENIFIDNIRMTDIATDAIGFNMFYSNIEPTAESGFSLSSQMVPVSAETPIFRKIYLKNILCRGAQRAVFLQGLPEMPITEIELENVTISAHQGFTAVDAQSVKGIAMSLLTSTPAFTLINAREVSLHQSLPPADEGVAVRIAGSRSASIHISGVGLTQFRHRVELAKEVPSNAVILSDE